MKMFSKIFWVVFLIVVTADFALPQTDRERGLKLYAEGKIKEAVTALEKASKQANSGGGDVWNALGLAYIKSEEIKKAVKAFAKAVDLNQQNAAFRTNLAYAYLLSNKPNKAQEESTKAIALDPRIALAFYIRGAANVAEGDVGEAVSDADQAIAVDPNYSAAYLLKSDALLQKFGINVGGGAAPIDEVKLLEQAKAVLELCLSSCRNNTQIEVQRKRLETLAIFYDYFSKSRIAAGDLNGSAATPNSAVAVAVDPSVTPLRILSKPHARYTDRARQTGVVGVIRLAVFFSETGRVTHTLLLKGLSGGLNENAVGAASSIKFEPARKDGKPISQIKIIEYSFNIY